MYAELFLMVAVAVDLAIRNLGTWLAMDFWNTWCPSIFSVALFVQFLMLIALSAREQKGVPFQLSPIGGVASVMNNKAHTKKN
jgi:hypothetical protein